ncbi:cyclin-dependent kinase inhibitor 7 [Impatiens glandulifera]|uniref:cyclin-dependent kinase inhibitor 7 n=1 Tax=Impatiens glandulifera TaxID=253017 RepID=UPI001FB0B3B8|nr:cyclin-dependent kinase inhibitor 7 [Impatiens glandulifera]
MEFIAVEPTICLRSSSKRRKTVVDGGDDRHSVVNSCPQDHSLLTAPDDASSCSSEIQLLREFRSTELKDVSKQSDHNSVADSLSIGSFSTGESSPSIENKISRKRQMESAPPLKKSKPKSSTEIRRNFPSAKMPPMEEIESFFSASELFEKKRFSEKYNFDVAKDVPLEGRYQWVQIKP